MRFHPSIVVAAAVAASAMTLTVRAQSATTRPVNAAPSAAPDASPEPGHGSADLTSLSLEDLMNVEVTSVSRKKQSIYAAPAAVAVISHEDMRRSGFSTIPDMLRLAPGVHVGRINSYSWAVGVRGMSSQFTRNLLVLQDGRSLYTPLFGGVFWDTVDYVTPDLERIEVIRGPGATLWGANAVNGVINITTKDAKDTQGWLLDTRVGNDDSTLSARYGAKLDSETYYRVYLKSKYNNELNDDNGDNAGDSWYGLRSGFRVDHYTNNNDTVTLQGEVNNNSIRSPFDYPTLTAPFVDPEIVSRNDTTAHLLARLNHRISDEADWSLQIYYDFLKVKYLGGNYEQSTADIDFHHNFKTGQRNEVTWGAGYRLTHSDINDTSLLQSKTSVRNDSVYSAFIQDTLTLQPDHWFLTVGSKFEHNDYTGFEVQPSARVLWTPNKQNSVWAAVSYAVRTPTRLGNDLNARLQSTQLPVGGGQTVPAFVEVQGQSGIESEELTAYELGYRVEPVSGLSFDIALFYNNYDKLQSFTPQAPQLGSPIIVPIAVGNDVYGNTFGGEIASTAKVTDTWRLTGSYSLLKTDITVPGASASADGLNNDGNAAPQHQAQLRSYWDIARNMEVNAGVFYVGSVDAFDVPGYVSSDVNFVWRPKEGMQLAVGVLNLFDNQHPEFDVSGGQGVGDETPRTLFAQFTYQF